MARVRWLAPAFNWAVLFANAGPSWLSVGLRRLPLVLCALLVKLLLLGVSHD